jgi:hypothetical protein
MVVFLAIGGCETTIPIVYIPPPSADIPLGPGEAQACEWGIFVFPPFAGSAQASLERAVALALREKGGDGLINATVDYEWSWYFFYNESCTRVKGTVVRTK